MFDIAKKLPQQGLKNICPEVVCLLISLFIFDDPAELLLTALQRCWDWVCLIDFKPIRNWYIKIAACGRECIIPVICDPLIMLLDIFGTILIRIVHEHLL